MSKRRLTAQDLLRFQLVDDPQVSPDGTQVAWVRTWLDAAENRYRSNIFLTQIATGVSRQLTHGTGSDSHPRWSPNGQVIAYLASGTAGAPQPALDPPPAVNVTSGSSQLLVIPATGGEPRPLTNLAGGVRNVVWSPDGSRLAFNSYVEPKLGLEFVAEAAPVTAEDPYTRFNRDVLVIERVRWQSDSAGFIGNYRSQIVWLPFDATATTLPTPVLLTNASSDLSAGPGRPRASG